MPHIDLNAYQKLISQFHTLKKIDKETASKNLEIQNVLENDILKLGDIVKNYEYNLVKLQQYSKEYATLQKKVRIIMRKVKLTGLKNNSKNLKQKINI